MAKVGLWLRGARGKYAGGVLQKGVSGGTIVRENVAPSNPKSAGQSAQRMKMAPAQQFYLAFSSILDHSFEAVQYGVKSRWYFLSKALKSSPVAYEKGMTGFVPCEYAVSEGSLPSTVYTAFDSTDCILYTSGRLLTSEEISYLGEADTRTRGQILPILRAYLGFDEDFNGQLTFLWVNTNSQGYKPQVARVIFDGEDDERTLQQAISDGDAIDDLLSFCIDTLDLDIMESEHFTCVNNWGGIASACIISKFTDNKWRRSNSIMDIEPVTKALFYSDAAVKAARESYQNKAVSELSEKYLNEGDE